MNTTAVNIENEDKTWGGGNRPMKASYGKMMMWFFYRFRCFNILRIFSVLWFFKI